MMVVMSIVAIMSTMGISALISINSTLIADKAAEVILSDIREAQNKAFSVAVKPGSNTEFPVAWVVKFSVQNTPINYENQLVAQYLMNLGTDTTPNYVQTDYDSSRDAVLGDAGFAPIIIRKTEGATVSTVNDLYVYYTAPFGKFYATDKPCTSSLAPALRASCSQNLSRPKNTQISGTTNAIYEIIIKYRSAEKVIKIDELGNAFISE